MKRIVAITLSLLLVGAGIFTFSGCGKGGGGGEEEGKTPNPLEDIVSSPVEEFSQNPWYGSVDADGVDTCKFHFFDDGIFIVDLGAMSPYGIYLEGEFSIDGDGNYLLYNCFTWDGSREYAGNYAIVVDDDKMEFTLLSFLDDLPGVLPFQEEGETVTLGFVDGETLDVSEIGWKDGDIAAFFYSDSYPDTTASLLDRLSFRYDFPNIYHGTTYVKCESWYPLQSEGYVVMPREKGSEVIVESLELDSNGNLAVSKLEYDGGGLVSIETGITEYIPKVRITVRSGGREVVMEPVRSGMDGSMILPKEGVLGIEITKAEEEYGDEVMRRAIPYILSVKKQTPLESDSEYAWSILSLAIQHCAEGWITRGDYVNEGDVLKVPGRDVRAWAYMLFSDLKEGEVPPEEGLGDWNGYDPDTDMYSFMFADGAVEPAAEIADKIVDGNTTVLVLYHPYIPTEHDLADGFNSPASFVQTSVVFVKDRNVPEELGGRRLVNMNSYYIDFSYMGLD